MWQGGYEHSKYKKSAKFGVIQWRVITTKAQISLQNIQKFEIEEEIKNIYAILKVINENIVDWVKKKGVRPSSFQNQSINYCKHGMARYVVYHKESFISVV